MLSQLMPYTQVCNLFMHIHSSKDLIWRIVSTEPEESVHICLSF